MDIESRKELSQCVLELPLKYREVIILFYYEEVSYQEITQLLGISNQTIKSRLYRGRNLLRKKLEGGRSND